MTKLSDAIDLETMLSPKDYVQIHQALHFTLGYAQKRVGTSIDGVKVSRSDCDALDAVISKVERVLETALRMKRAADDALVAKPHEPKRIYAGVEKKLSKPDNEVLKFRSTEHNQGELK